MDDKPKHAKYSTAVISLALSLTLDANVSLRGVEAVFKVLNDYLGDDFPTPCYSSIRAWLLRLSSYRLNCPLEHATDWVWFVDHTVQIGPHRGFVIAGSRLSKLTFEQPLKVTDLQTIAVVPMTDWEHRTIYDALKTASRRTGVPSYILSDKASDLLGGIQLFQNENRQLKTLPDLAHFAANLLKHSFKRDEDWQPLLQRLQLEGNKLRQTQWAHLVPPRRGNKQRYMSVRRDLKYAEMILALISSAQVEEKVKKHFGWLKQYQEKITQWSAQEREVERITSHLKRYGLSQESEEKLKRTESDIKHESVRQIRERLMEYVKEHAPREKGVTIPVSTEALESTFGKLKSREKQQNQSGITELVQTVAAITGERITASETKRAMEATPEKGLERFRGELGNTVQHKRKDLYSGKYQN